MIRCPRCQGAGIPEGAQVCVLCGYQPLAAIAGSGLPPSVPIAAEPSGLLGIEYPSSRPHRKKQAVPLVLMPPPPDEPPPRKGVARSRWKLLVFALVLLLGLGPVAVWLLQPTAGATTAIWQTVSSPIATESSLAVLPPAPVDAAPVDPSILDTGLTDTTYLQSDSTAKRARPAAPARRVTRRHPTVSHPIRRHAPAPAPTPARPVLRTTLTEPALLSVNSLPWGTVRIDGREVGHTPQRNLPLYPGVHLLRVERPGFRPYEQTIEAAPGQQLRLVEITLAPESR